MLLSNLCEAFSITLPSLISKFCWSWIGSRISIRIAGIDMKASQKEKKWKRKIKTENPIAVFTTPPQVPCQLQLGPQEKQSFFSLGKCLSIGKNIPIQSSGRISVKKKKSKRIQNKINPPKSGGVGRSGAEWGTVLLRDGCSGTVFLPLLSWVWVHNGC